MARRTRLSSLSLAANLNPQRKRDGGTILAHFVFAMSLLLWLYLALAPLNPPSLVLATQARDAFQQRCLSFAPEKLIRNATRTVLEYVADGTTLEFPDNVASCARPSQRVSTDLCRVALSIPTSNRSSITFELWLPKRWQAARYLSTGNGGVDGCWCLLLT